MNYLERIQKAAREFGVENSSSSVVIPVSIYYDEFFVLRGWKENKSGPEPTYKNAGGDWGAANIPSYAEGNGVEAELEKLKLNRDILLALCGVSELWQEAGFFIPPSKLPLMFKLVEHHVPDKNALDNVPGTPPHIKVYFGITDLVFTDKPSLDPEEIHDCTTVRVSSTTGSIDTGGRLVRVARGHADAICRAHEALHSGTPKSEIICNGVKDCPICH